MSRVCRAQEPPEELRLKILNAVNAIARQRPRVIKCPYCRHNSIVVFEDTRGHVQAKCKNCGRETVFDVLSMRKIVFHLQEKER